MTTSIGTDGGTTEASGLPATAKSADWFERAILVYGPRKAGTTLFQNLLDGSRELLVYPAELKLKLFIKQTWGQSDDLERYLRRTRVPGVRSARFSIETYRSLWERVAADRPQLGLKDLIRLDLDHVIRSTSALATPTMWCAKEVGGDTAAVLRLWREMFKDSRELFIVRDPRMVTRAVLNERRRRGVRLSWRDIVFQTLDPRHVVVTQSQLMNEPTVFTIAYEDLVADTPAVMKSVIEFLDLPYAANFAYPSIFGEPVVVATSSRYRPEVFADQAEWSDGLTWRERLIVALTGAVARFLPAYAVDYASLRRRISVPRSGR